MTRYVHSGVTLEYLRSSVLAGKKPFGDDTPKEEALELLVAEELKGYRFWPASCGVIRPDGHCAGHTKEM